MSLLDCFGDSDEGGDDDDGVTTATSSPLGGFTTKSQEPPKKIQKIKHSTGNVRIPPPTAAAAASATDRGRPLLSGAEDTGDDAPDIMGDSDDDRISRRRSGRLGGDDSTSLFGSVLRPGNSDDDDDADAIAAAADEDEDDHNLLQLLTDQHHKKPQQTSKHVCDDGQAIVPPPNEHHKQSHKYPNSSSATAAASSKQTKRFSSVGSINESGRSKNRKRYGIGFGIGSEGLNQPSTRFIKNDVDIRSTTAATKQQPRQQQLKECGQAWQGMQWKQNAVQEQQTAQQKKREELKKLFWKPSPATTTQPNSNGSSTGKGRRKNRNDDDNDDVIGGEFIETLRGLPGHRRDDNEDGNEDNKEDEGEEGDGAAEEMVPVKHVAFADAESALGPVSKDDQYCYICDKIYGTSEATLHPDIVALIEMISNLRRKRKDKIGIAHSVKTWFEENIRGPANQAAAEAEEQINKEEGGRGDDKQNEGGMLDVKGKQIQGVSPWTLRSIYYHITDHDNTIGNQIDGQIDYLKRMQETIEDNGMWRAPATRVKSGVLKKADLKPDADTGEFLMKVAGKLQQMFAIRVRLTVSELMAKNRAGGGGTQSRAASSGGGGSGEGGGSGRSGSGVNSMSVSTLLGGVSSSGLPTSIDSSASRKRPWGALHDM